MSTIKFEQRLGHIFAVDENNNRVPITLELIQYALDEAEAEGYRQGQADCAESILSNDDT